MTDGPLVLVLDGERMVILSAEQADELQREVLELGSGDDARTALRRLLEVEKAFTSGQVSTVSLNPSPMERPDVEAILAALEREVRLYSHLASRPDPIARPRERSPGTRAKRAWKRRRRSGRGGRR